MNAASLARLHGLANIGGGLWPLVHMRSFEAMFGPKVDRWLVQTVAGLLVANGITQLTAGTSQEAVATSRRLGVGTAMTLAAIDLRYAITGRISKVYLLDAALELGVVAAWASTLRRPRESVEPLPVRHGPRDAWSR